MVFDISLLAIADSPKVLPEAERKPHPKASVTESGLSYRIIKRGKKRVRPGPTSLVKVHYTGWMASDGVMFDSTDGMDPRVLPLDGVIAGWTEGIQLMGKGGKARFWIPGELAYGETDTASGTPYGLLVFDVTLIDFNNAESP